jgi:hypothetical protein
MRPTTSLLLLSLATCAQLPSAESGTLTTAKPFPLVLLQTVSAVAIPHTYTVNGFSTASLASMGADDDHHVHGFTAAMEEYSIIPPYFLRQGANQLAVDFHLDLSYMVASDDGPWTMACRVASTTYDPKLASYDTEYADSELLKLVSPAMKKIAQSAQPQRLTGTFQVTQPLPAWSWEHGIAIEDTQAVRDSLYAAYADFHASLAALHGAPVQPGAAPAHPPAALAPGAFANAVRASMAEYITACELRGVRYGFLDELLYASAHLSLRGYDAEMASKAAEPVKPQLPDPHPTPPAPMDDGPVVDSAPPGPDGKPPARLFLTALQPEAGLTMTIFAGGTLARLDDKNAEPLIVFRSNYNDGPWGERGTEKLSAEVWFRRTADGHWAIDGIASMHLASLHIMNNQISELVDLGGF